MRIRYIGDYLPEEWAEAIYERISDMEQEYQDRFFNKLLELRENKNAD
jgi:hypothetical protein